MLSGTGYGKTHNNKVFYDYQTAMVSIPLSEYRNLVEHKATAENKVREAEAVAVESELRNRNLSEENRRLMDEVAELKEKLNVFDEIISGTYFEEE